MRPVFNFPVNNLISIHAVTEVISDGLQTTVFPAMSAGASLNVSK